VRKTYGRFHRHTVLRGIDLDLARGEVVGLIGANGAGKTTLMSCLLGFLRIDEGTIAFDGLPNHDLAIRARTGFVPERMNLGRNITGRRFVRYMALLAGIARTSVDGRVDAMLARLEMAGAADQRLAEYSRGMLQRIALCQALIHQPDFLFLDEPASGLDPNGVLLVRDLITEQRQRGAAILLNSHQLSEIEKVCDRVLFLRDGVIAREETLRHTGRLVVAIRLLSGSFDSVKIQRIAGTPVHEDVVIVERANESEIAAAVREIAMSGAGVVEVRPHSADLEGMFRGVA
jgi:ABC-2 type transport system ATP-binding protein